jgi:hypothetical protein
MIGSSSVRFSSIQVDSARRIEADVGGDPVEPGAKRGSTIEAVQAAPGADQRFLQSVVGVDARAEHAITMPGEGSAVHLKVLSRQHRAKR